MKYIVLIAWLSVMFYGCRSAAKEIVVDKEKLNKVITEQDSCKQIKTIDPTCSNIWSIVGCPDETFTVYGGATIFENAYKVGIVNWHQFTKTQQDSIETLFWEKIHSKFVLGDDTFKSFSKATFSEVKYSTAQLEAWAFNLFNDGIVNGTAIHAFDQFIRAYQYKESLFCEMSKRGIPYEVIKID